MNLTFSIAWCAGIVLIVLLANRRLEQKERLPNLATMLGVLGTFVGICVGLFGLNISPSAPNANLVGSVQSLLSGLRFAFITSVFGMGTAVLLKIVHAKAYEKPPEAVVMIKSISESLAEGNAGMAEIVATVKEGVSTLTAEVQVMRSDIKAFEAEVSEKCAKAIEKALAGTIDKFNAEISRQCGESFRKLAESTNNLLEWQRQHQQMIQEQTAQIERAVMALDACEQTLTSVVERSERFSTIAERLEHALTGLDSIVTQMERGTAQIVESANLAADMLEPAQHAIQKGTENLNASTPLMMSAIEAFTEAANEINTGMQDQRELILQSQEEVNAALQSGAVKAGDSIDAMIRERADALHSLEKATEAALTRSMNELHEQLSQIAKQFTQDYGPLVNQMRNIMELAKDLSE